MPDAGPGTIDRPRAVALMEDASRRPFTLLSASAGWGKTTLLAQWAGGRPDPVAWATLTREDNSRQRFLATLTAGIGMARPDLAHLEVPPPREIDQFLAALVAAVRSTPELVVVVLDAAEHLNDPAVWADIEFLADAADGNLRLVVASRADPALPLQRMRIAGRLGEVRASDLAFTDEESAAMLASADVTLTPGTQRLLTERTEGWPAALQLVRVALERHVDADAFVQTFGGTDRAVSDYLTAEVLGTLDPPAMDLLVRTSILDEVNEDLAAAVMGEPGAGQPLEDLIRSEGMISSADEHGIWHRYHPLLLEALRARLRRLPRSEVQELHQRAADWFEQEGMTMPALHHRAAADDWDAVAETVATTWVEWYLRGRGDALRSTLERMPSEVVAAEPELGLALGCLTSESHPAAGQELADRATEASAELEPARRRRFQLSRLAFTVSHSADIDELTQVAGFTAADWDGLAAEAGEDIRAVVLCNLGASYFWLGRTRSAARALEESCGLAMATGNDHVVVRCRSFLGAVNALTGRPYEARGLAQSAVDLARSKGWAETPQVAMAYWAIAVTHLLAAELDAAEDWLRQGHLAVATSRDSEVRLAIAIARAHLLCERGDTATALEILTAATVPAPRQGWQPARAVTLEAGIHLATGEPARARERLDEVEGALPAHVIAGAWARVHMAEGDPQAALASLDHPWDPAHHTPEVVIQALALRALAREEAGDPREADRALEAALEHAEPAGSRHMFHFSAGSMAELLRRHADRGGSHAAFARELLAPGAQLVTTQERALVALEPLSERELAVLRFLPTMLSNAEIAAELFISVNTVKTHLRHIYRKLGVDDRRRAVRRGRELHLLNPGLASR